MAETMRPRANAGRTWLLLAVTLMAAAVVRLWGIDWGLPYIYHPDEPTNLSRIMEMLETGDPNPRWFHYGSLMFYLNAGGLWVASSLRELFGAVGLSGVEPPTMIALASGVTAESWLMLVPRSLTIAAGIGTTAIIYWAVFHVTRRHSSAVFSGLLFALAPVAVSEGRTFTPDTYTALFSAGALFFAIRIYERGVLRDYALAGAMVGLAVGSKYNAALVAVAVVTAHVMRQRRGPAASRGMLLSFGSALAAFVATTPFAVLDARRFLSDLGFELVHYSSGHIGFEAGPGVYLAAVTVSFSVGLLLVPLAFTDPETRPAAKIVGVYAAVYIGALSMFQVTFARNLLPVFPAIAIVVGLGAHSALARLRDSLPVMRTVIYLLCLLALLLASTALTLDYVHLEDREPASDWVRNNIEAGSTVVSESYSPWLDPDRFDLRMVPYVIAVDPNQSWDYLLVTHNGSGRFDEDPLRYPEQVATLDSIRTTSCLAAMFPGVVEIRSRECS